MYPYPGLRPFNEHEGHIFYGRHNHVTQLLDRLLQHHCVFVLGPSGCGKSSLVQPGLVDILKAGEIPDGKRLSQSLIVRPHVDPFRQFAIGLQALKPDLDIDGAADAFLQNRGLIHLIETSFDLSQERILIVFDQFEELFAFARTAGKKTAAKYVDNIVNLIRAKLPNVFVVLTMRSDFVGDCTSFQGLSEVLNETQFLVPPLTIDDYEDIVVGPAEDLGATIDSDFIASLRDEIAIQRQSDYDRGFDVLPLVQHMSQQLWIASCEQVNVAPQVNYNNFGDEYQAVHLTLDTYRSIGRIDGALNAHGNAVYEQLIKALAKSGFDSSGTESLIKTILCALTNVQSDHQNTRAPQKLEQLIAACNDRMKALGHPVAGIDQAVAMILKKFSDTSCCFIESRMRGDAQYVDMGHEAFMRQWRRLRRWLRQDNAAGNRWLRLKGQAQAWESGDEQLLSEQKLLVEQAWISEYKPDASWSQRYGGQFATVQKFVDHSGAELAAQEKAHRNRTRIIGALAAALVVTIGLFSILFVKDKIDKQNTELEQSNLQIKKLENIAAAVNQKDPAVRAILLQNSLREIDRRRLQLNSAAGQLPSARIGPMVGNPYIWDSAYLARPNHMVMATDAGLVKLSIDDGSRTPVHSGLSNKSLRHARIVGDYNENVIAQCPKSIGQKKWMQVETYNAGGKTRLIAANEDGTIVLWDDFVGDSSDAGTCLLTFKEMAYLVIGMSGKELIAVDYSGNFNRMSLQSDASGQITITSNPIPLQISQNIESLTSDVTTGTWTYVSGNSLAICDGNDQCVTKVLGADGSKNTPSFSYSKAINRDDGLVVGYVVQYPDQFPIIGIVRTDNAETSIVSDDDWSIEIKRPMDVFAASVRHVEGRLEVVISDEQGRLFLWREDTQKLVVLGDMGAAIHRIHLHSDTNTVVTTTKVGSLARWDMTLKDLEPSVELPLNGMAKSDRYFDNSTTIGAYRVVKGGVVPGADSRSQLVISHQSESGKKFSRSINYGFEHDLIDLAYGDSSASGHNLIGITGDGKLIHTLIADNANGDQVVDWTTIIDYSDQYGPFSSCFPLSKDKKCTVKLLSDKNDDSLTVYLSDTRKDASAFSPIQSNSEGHQVVVDALKPILMTTSSGAIPQPLRVQDIVIAGGGKYVAFSEFGWKATVLQRSEDSYLPISVQTTNGCISTLTDTYAVDIIEDSGDLILAASNSDGIVRFWMSKTSELIDKPAFCLPLVGTVTMPYSKLFTLLLRKRADSLEVLLGDQLERVFELWRLAKSDNTIALDEREQNIEHLDYQFSNARPVSTLLSGDRLYVRYNDGLLWRWDFDNTNINDNLDARINNYCMSENEVKYLFGRGNEQEGLTYICPDVPAVTPN